MPALPVTLTPIRAIRDEFVYIRENMTMTRYDYLIIGGGLAGVTAAETIRVEDPRGSIAIVGDEPHILYSRVLIPSYLKGKISRHQLFLRRSEDFSEKQIDLLLGAQVTAVDPARKEVAFADRDPIAYQKLLITSGGPGRQAPERARHILRGHHHRLN